MLEQSFVWTAAQPTASPRSRCSSALSKRRQRPTSRVASGSADALEVGPPTIGRLPLSEMSAAYHIPLTIKDTLENIAQNRFVLPAIQRELV